MKKRRGDTETRGQGDKTSRLRVSVSGRRRLSSSRIAKSTASPRLFVSASRRRPLPLITLLTDFGTSDYFAGAMKGVILSINPRARIVDLTHDIPPQDVTAAAFTLLAAYQSFPAGTIHLAVVDPGVGSSRRPILAVAGAQYFVGPDNGIFSYVFEREPDVQVFHLTSEEYFRHPVSATFHGRDVFSPVAAALSNGVLPETLGKKIDDHVSLPAVVPEQSGKGRRRGCILHIDHFGNCITNFTQQDVPAEWLDSGVRLTVNGEIIRALRRCFSDEGDHHEKLFAIWGSAGFLEIAAMNQSAAEMLNARRGQTVVISTSHKLKK